MALTESAAAAGFAGLASWCDDLEETLSLHSGHRCLTAGEIAALTGDGQTLTATLSSTLDQVTRAAADPRFTACPVQQLLDRLSAARDSWILLCAEHGFDPQ